MKKISKKFLVVVNLLLLLTTSCASVDWSISGTKSHSDALDARVDNNWEENRKSVAAQLADFKRRDPKMYDELERSVSDDRIIIEHYRGDGTQVGTSVGR